MNSIRSKLLACCAATLTLCALSLRATIVQIPVLEDTTAFGYYMADGGGPDISHPWGHTIQGEGLAANGSRMPAFSWFKFQLADLPQNVTLNSVSLRIPFDYIYFYSSVPAASTVGAYYGHDDSWHESLSWRAPGITWNNQPLASLDSTPQSLATPFVGVTSWNVTSAAADAYTGDGIITLMLKFTDPDFGGIASFGYSLHSAAILEVDYSPVPEPTTLLAGTLLAIPFGLQFVRRALSRRHAL